MLGFVFAAQFALLDLILRGPRAWWDAPLLAVGAIASAIVWWHVTALEHRGARALFALVAGMIGATQIGFFRYYHVFFGIDAAGAARFMWGDTKPMLLRIAPWLALGSIAVAVVEWLALSRCARPKVRSWVVVTALAALTGAFTWRGEGPPDASTVGALVRFASPTKRANVGTVTVPEVRTTAPPPAVLLVLDESVRASDYCTEGGPTCVIAPKTAAATPERVVLREMRAVASYTALSCGALFTGHLPIEGRQVIATAPMLFDVVHALRTPEGARPTVHYVSAQTESFFERQTLRAELDTFVSVADLVGHPVEDVDEVIDAGIDRLLADRAEAVLAHVHPPFLFVAHFGATHAPYHVDDENAPYRPYTHAAMWSGMTELHAAYKDSIYAQDAQVARVIDAFRKAAGSAPSLIVFTSDHGEAFGEHAAIHHGQSLYDEQIHVPGFAVLEHDDRLAALKAHENDFVTHLDVLPTIIDMFGARGAFPLRTVEAALRGRSLLRPFAADDEVQLLPLTNCTDVFPCPVKTWGMMRGAHALTAQPWDYDWRCVDLHDDATLLDRGSPDCVAMGKASHAHFPTLPYGAANPF